MGKLSRWLYWTSAAMSPSNSVLTVSKIDMWMSSVSMHPHYVAPCIATLTKGDVDYSFFSSSPIKSIMQVSA